LFLEHELSVANDKISPVARIIFFKIIMFKLIDNPKGQTVAPYQTNSGIILEILVFLSKLLPTFRYWRWLGHSMNFQAEQKYCKQTNSSDFDS
jgi:hypothetical protein